MRHISGAWVELEEIYQLKKDTGGNMKTYIGSKIIQAEPEDRDGEPGYRVHYPDGYVSWSPKDVFETAYREVTDSEKALI